MGYHSSDVQEKYFYIPAMIDEIVEHKTSDGTGRQRTIAADHPLQLQSTIGHIPPSLTSDIVSNKRSRFK